MCSKEILWWNSFLTIQMQVKLGMKAHTYNSNIQTVSSRMAWVKVRLKYKARGLSRAQQLGEYLQEQYQVPFPAPVCPAPHVAQVLRYPTPLGPVGTCTHVHPPIQMRTYTHTHNLGFGWLVLVFCFFKAPVMSALEWRRQ